MPPRHLSLTLSSPSLPTNVHGWCPGGWAWWLVVLSMVIVQKYCKSIPQVLQKYSQSITWCRLWSGLKVSISSPGERERSNDLQEKTQTRFYWAFTQYPLLIYPNLLLWAEYNNENTFQAIRWINKNSCLLFGSWGGGDNYQGFSAIA